MINNFKEKYPFENRRKESSKIYQKYPDRVPIIVQKYYKSELPEVKKCKYLVPKDMNMSQFLFVIRKGIQLDSSQSIFITVNNELVTASKLVFEVYDKYKDEDGFLYVMYTDENVFG